MFFIELCTFLCILQLVASSSVTCDIKNKRLRTRYRKILENNGEVFMAFSLSHNFLMKNENIKNEKATLEFDFKVNQKMPVTFIPIPMLGSMQLIISSKRRTTFTGGFWFQQQFKTEQNKKQVYVFERRRAEVMQNQTFLFEACRMKMESKYSMDVEKSLLLIFEGNATNEATVIEILKSGSENITTNNFELDEFEFDGFEICNYMEFYINECTLKEGNLFNSIYFTLALTLIYIAIVIVIVALQKMLTCLKTIKKKCTRFLQEV